MDPIRTLVDMTRIQHALASNPFDLTMVPNGLSNLYFKNTIFSLSELILLVTCGTVVSITKLVSLYVTN